MRTFLDMRGAVLAGFAPGWLLRRLILMFGMVILTGGGLSPLAKSAEMESGFAAANSLYAQGQYAQAEQAYLGLLISHQASAALYFNLGNACMKTGKLGRAIVYFRWALELSPRDADIRANLQWARARANQGSSPPAGKWRVGLSWLSLAEWTWLATGAWWACLGLFALLQIHPEWKMALASFRKLLIALAILAGGGLGLRLSDYWGPATAVVVVKEAAVRYGPLEDARVFYQLPEGAEVTGLDQQEKWLQVRDASQRTGWIMLEQAWLIRPGMAGALTNKTTMQFL